MDAEAGPPKGEKTPANQPPIPTERTSAAPGGRYDLLILGGGPGGLSAAAEGARLGARVALLLPRGGEQRAPAAMWAAQQVLGQAARLADLRPIEQLAGPSDPRSPLPAFGELLRRARKLRDKAVWAGSPEELAAAGVDLYLGDIRLRGRDSAEVDGHLLRFRRAVVVPPVAFGPRSVAGADEAGCLISPNLLDLEELPTRLAILGAGPRECHWAQVFGRLGSRVHLVSRQAGLLPGHRPDVAAIIERRLTAEAILLRLGCDEVAVERTGKLPALVIARDGRREKLFVDHVLSDGPLAPEVAELGLESAKVAVRNERVAVSEHLRTSNRRIYFADLCRNDSLCGPAIVEAVVRLCVHNALGFGRPRRIRQVVPCLALTDPQLLQMGWTAAESAQRRVKIDTFRCDLDEVDELERADCQDGFVELHVRRGGGCVVGATAVARNVLPLVGLLALLLTRRLSLEHLPQMAFTGCPSLEALRRAALSWARTPRPGWWSRLLKKRRSDQ